MLRINSLLIHYKFHFQLTSGVWRHLNLGRITSDMRHLAKDASFIISPAFWKAPLIYIVRRFILIDNTELWNTSLYVFCNKVFYPIIDSLGIFPGWKRLYGLVVLDSTQNILGRDEWGFRSYCNSRESLLLSFSTYLNSFRTLGQTQAKVIFEKKVLKGDIEYERLL